MELTHLSEDLISRAAAGDAPALSDLLRAARPFAFHQALCRIRDPDQAEDIAQAVLIKLFRGIRSFREESRFSTWLFRITENEIISHLRGERRARGLVDQFIPECEGRIRERSPGTLLAETIDATRMKGVVQEELRKMARLQRDALRLVGFEGLRPREAARVLGKSQSNLRSGLSRARSKVRGRLMRSRWKESLALLERPA